MRLSRSRVKGDPGLTGPQRPKIHKGDQENRGFQGHGQAPLRIVCRANETECWHYAGI